MKILLLLTGSILLVLGLISMLTPIPGGVLFITLGGGLVICNSDRAMSYITKCRVKFHRLDQSMTWIENKMGERLSGPLRRTRPSHAAQENTVQDNTVQDNTVQENHE